jgi:Protein of unknown function (DUF2510)
MADLMSRDDALMAAPAGWYADPLHLRYWDGAQWTAQTRDTTAMEPVTPELAEVVPVPVAAPEPVVVPVPVAPAARSLDAPGAEEHGMWHEAMRLLGVLALALAAGALVTGIGIALTV